MSRIVERRRGATTGSIGTKIHLRVAGYKRVDAQNIALSIKSHGHMDLERRDPFSRVSLSL